MLINKPKVFVLFMCVTLACIIRLIIYAYVGFRGIGYFDLANYFGVLINLILYLFILFYTYKYFIKENFITLNPLIFKCGISALATLVGLHNNNKTIFMLTALMVFLIPYVSDSIHAKQKLVAFTATIIFILSIAISVIFIIHPSINYLSGFGKTIYNLDALNPTMEWMLISFLLLCKRINYNGNV